MVNIRRAPAKGRSHKLDPKYIGPWEVVENGGGNGLSFSCRMTGRRIRRTKAHVSNIKPFHLRPAHLDSSQPHALLTAEQLHGVPHDEWLYRLVDRRSNPNGSWDYKWITRDGHLSNWRTENEALEMVMPWTLDVFHALFELRRAEDIPNYAHRICRADRKAMTKEAALTLIPLRTQVVREHRESLHDHVTYIWGSVQGYSAPYWRVRHEDCDWEDFTKRQLLATIALAESTRKRAVALGSKAAAPVITQIMAPAMPADFGAAYLQQGVRVRMGTGWSRGELVEFNPRASKYTFQE